MSDTASDVLSPATPFAGPSRWLDLIEAIGDYVFTEDDSPWECRMISAEKVERYNLFVKNAAGSE